MNVSVAEAKNKLTQLLQLVERGERVTICRHGHPIVELIQAGTKRAAPEFETLKGKLIVDRRALEPMTDEEVDAFLAGRY